MNIFKATCLSSLIYFCACAQVNAEVLVSLSVDSVQTKRAKNVLVRVIQFNTDRYGLRLESIKPIENKMVDFMDITNFTVDGRKYEFSKCDELLVNSVEVGQNQVTATFECFVPKAIAVLANCTITINDDKFSAMVCARQSQ